MTGLRATNVTRRMSKSRTAVIVFDDQMLCIEPFAGGRDVQVSSAFKSDTIFARNGFKWI